MTIDEQYYSAEGYTEEGPQEYTGAATAMQPVPVYSLTEDNAPEYGSCMTWPIPIAGSNQPIQILPRRIRRSKAKIYPLWAGTLPSVTANNGTGAVSPGANQVLVSATLPAGTWSINWIIGIGGTTGNPEIDNFALIVGGVTVAISINGSTAGATYPQMPIIVTLNAPTVVTVNTIVLGTVASVYRVEFTATDATSEASLIINSKQEPLMGSNPQGLIVVNNLNVIEWETQQPCYAIALTAPLSVSVLDQSYAER
jgi:hypothetical protein